ncbi:MAG: hypothetical protein KC546_04565 [Anaerolineae bacterium]|nr:hypothetical protein [Anaerolineae bacterium]MCA9891581.1 hypothetical protein [Anaerolineae bacterium]MCB9461959.1 hypothetical protein [Anaerolineaceae bacterium]
MASQLREVLNRFSDQSAPLSINQMAHDMGLEPGVLHSMIDYWVRKGKLREINSSGQACTTCGVKGTCPFTVALPRYYELVTDQDNPSCPPCGCQPKT